MFERFTDSARQVVVLAQEEARELRHSYIGTEHILLGLLREGEGVAASALQSLGVTLDRARERVFAIVGPGEEVTAGQSPFTPRAKRVLELSLREALSLGNEYIGTEHILLGLTRESDGVAARILLEMGADYTRIRSEVLRILDDPEVRSRIRHTVPRATAPTARTRPAPPARASELSLLTQLGPEIRQRFGREADVGDLLLVLASVPHSLLARALSELGIDVAALRAALERAHAAGPPSPDEELERIDAQQQQASEPELLAALRSEKERIRDQRNAQALARARALLNLPNPD